LAEEFYRCIAGRRAENLTPPGTPQLHSPKSREPSNDEACSLLHIATISGVLAALMRHFRASLASLPLLGQAIGNLPIGTWSVDSALVQHETNGSLQVAFYIQFSQHDALTPLASFITFA
jgi:hypothetical protein